MKHKENPKTEDTYLHRLGKALLRYFPREQVWDILEDYEEHFSLGRERQGTDEAMIAALGSPETVASALLREMPEGRSYFIRHAVRWGALFLLACASLILRYSYIRSLREFATYFFLTAGMLSLFVLLHGPEQAEVEGRFLPPASRPKAVLYALPILAVLGLEALTQYLIQGVIGNLPYPFWGDSLARRTGTILEWCQFGLVLLLVWVLWRTCTASVRYFPVIVHTTGAMLAIRGILNLLHGMDVSAGAERVPQLLLLCLLPYVFGIFLTLLFLCFIWKAGKKGAV